MRTPALAALSAAVVLAAPLAGHAQDRGHYGPPGGPPPGVGPGVGSGPAYGGGVPPGALDDLHAREGALRAHLDEASRNRTMDYRVASHGVKELQRLKNEEDQWRRRQGGRIYPNQLRSMDDRLQGIRDFVDRPPPIRR